MGNLATQVFPKQFDYVQARRISWKCEEYKLIRILLQEFGSLLAMMNDEVVHDQNDFLSLIVW